MSTVSHEHSSRPSSKLINGGFSLPSAWWRQSGSKLLTLWTLIWHNSELEECEKSTGNGQTYHNKSSVRDRTDMSVSCNDRNNKKKLEWIMKSHKNNLSLHLLWWLFFLWALFINLLFNWQSVGRASPSTEGETLRSTTFNWNTKTKTTSMECLRLIQLASNRFFEIK